MDNNLREMAAHIVRQCWRTERHVDAIDEIVTFVQNYASDVSAEKDKRIAELKAEVSALSESNDNLERNYHISAGDAKVFQQHIAELEEEIRDLKSKNELAVSAIEYSIEQLKKLK